MYAAEGSDHRPPAVLQRQRSIRFTAYHGLGARLRDHVRRAALATSTVVQPNTNDGEKALLFQKNLKNIRIKMH